MRHGGRRSRAGMALSAMIILLAVTGSITMVMVSWVLGSTLIGGSVAGAMALLVLQRRNPTTQNH